MTLTTGFLAAIAGLAALTASACDQMTNDDRAGVTQAALSGDGELAPSGKGFLARGNHGPDQAPNGNGNSNGKGKPSADNGIQYHNGPVMLGTVDIYYIWYGDWSGNPDGQALLVDLASNIGGSGYWAINTTYTNGSGAAVSNAVAYKGSTNNNYSLGKSLTDANIAAIVASAITSGALPKDTNGVYFVLTSADVTASSGFCNQYCGWHTHTTVGGSDIKYAFVGNPDRCPSACAAQAVGPNGANVHGADGMASIISHEAEEATTDPDLNAWYDKKGMENADKCAWTFGTTWPSGGAGIVANQHIGSHDFLIQRNWVNAAGGYCDTDL